MANDFSCGNGFGCFLRHCLMEIGVEIRAFRIDQGHTHIRKRFIEFRLNHIHALRNGSDIHIIALTCTDSHGEMVKNLQEGEHGILNCPVTQCFQFLGKTFPLIFCFSKGKKTEFFHIRQFFFCFFQFFCKIFHRIPLQFFFFVFFFCSRSGSFRSCCFRRSIFFSLSFGRNNGFLFFFFVVHFLTFFLVLY